VNADWIKVDDPIGLGVDPLKDVPNMGHIAGYAMFRINADGYQRVPAGPQYPIEGVRGVLGTVIKDDQDRTDVGDLGVNLIQFVDGAGYCLRNARMPSTDEAYLWFNQIFMRIVYKKTFEESFQNIENDSVGAPLLRVVNGAIESFLREDWNGVPRTGGKSAFFRYVQNGRDSTFDDVVEIICDDSNNKLADTLRGKVDAEIYFTPPPPAESIQIGVGIKLNVGVR
jgi:phage tail sheath protein FI